MSFLQDFQRHTRTSKANSLLPTSILWMTVFKAYAKIDANFTVSLQIRRVIWSLSKKFLAVLVIWQPFVVSPICYPINSPTALWKAVFVKLNSWRDRSRYF
jgi:hypothetical protein